MVDLVCAGAFCTWVSVERPVPMPELEAAQGRPQHQHRSARATALERLAAAYGYSLARNPCFADSNARIALAVIDVFLRLNGRELVAEEVDASAMIQSLAAGELTEEQLPRWLGEHVRDCRGTRASINTIVQWIYANVLGLIDSGFIASVSTCNTQRFIARFN